MIRMGLLTALIAAALSIAVGAEAQGLGDAARREKERRSQPKPKSTDTTHAKTYTGDDLLGLAGGAAQYGGESTSSTEASDSTTPATPAMPAGSFPLIGRSEDAASSDSSAGESYWRSRAQSARSRVAAAEKVVSDLESQATRTGPVVPGPTSPACQAGVRVPPGGVVPGLSPIALRDQARGQQKTCDAEVERQQRGQALQSRLDSARQELARARKALEDLEEEARRAGALPGWLR